MIFKITSKVVLRELCPDGTNREIVGVNKTESFEGSPKDFKQHYQMAQYYIGNHLDREFDKVFPKKTELAAPPSRVEDDEIPF